MAELWFRHEKIGSIESAAACGTASSSLNEVKAIQGYHSFGPKNIPFYGAPKDVTTSAMELYRDSMECYALLQQISQPKGKTITIIAEGVDATSCVRSLSETFGLIGFDYDSVDFYLNMNFMSACKRLESRLKEKDFDFRAYVRSAFERASKTGELQLAPDLAVKK